MDLKFIHEGKEYFLEETERVFLFPYLLRFALVNNISLDSEGALEVDDVLAPSLRAYLEEALSSLLRDSYETPAARHRQKYYTYYEKFEFEGQRYVVNYTSSSVGRLMYLLALRLRLLSEGRVVFFYPSQLTLG